MERGKLIVFIRQFLMVYNRFTKNTINWLVSRNEGKGYKENKDFIPVDLCIRRSTEPIVAFFVFVVFFV